MRLNPVMIEAQAGEEEYNAGKEYEEAGLVRLKEELSSSRRYSVGPAPSHIVALTAEREISCSCAVYEERGCCRHIAAVQMYLERTGETDILLQGNAAAISESIRQLAENSVPREATLRLEVTLVMPKLPGQPVRLSLRTGEKKLYTVRNVYQFMNAMVRREATVFGKDFEYQPQWMRYTENDQQILNTVEKMTAAARLRGEEDNGIEARMPTVPSAYVGELLGLLRDTPMKWRDAAGNTYQNQRITETEIPMRFELQLRPRGLRVTARMNAWLIPMTEDCAYVTVRDRIYAVPEIQRELVRTLWYSQYDGKTVADYPLSETGTVIGEILPYLKLRGAVELDETLKKRLVKLPLKAEIYLDKAEWSILARVCFRYGETELNPFGAVREKIALGKGEKLLLRDSEAEQTVLEILANAGFHVTREDIRLSGQDAIFEFVNSGVAKLREHCEIFASRDFQKLTPRRPTLSGSVRMENGHLEIALKTDGEPTPEILGIMEALSRRRRYYRLKDGSFLDLTDMEEWQEPAERIWEAALRDGNSLNRDRIILRGYRAGYLVNMLEGRSVDIRVEDSVLEVTDSLRGAGRSIPAPAVAVPLREYQQRGYEWLYNLDRLHMGGVLADAMGLGKTAQVISLLQATRERGRTSLVIAPTSLTYNWLSEINRFAPDLSAAVIGGTAAQRAGLIRHVTEHGDVDVVITSYPLIRRDISLLKDHPFRFVILDEAQYIKNAGSVAAVTVKQLQADTRLALTGTPMENGVGELWSIFDFVLPGYLPGYTAFLRRYQDGEDSDDLRKRIQPFLFRRLKQDVLEELPDKNEVVLKAQMTAEQEKVYTAAMERLRPRVNRIMDEKGLGKGRMEVLSAITELRQVCCHPSLVLDGYTGGSGKEELLMEILPELIADGRRMLIFSQFTSMLKLLRPRLEENGIRTMYLDGNTPATERLDLTEQFNRGDTPVFLISLKAGGAGLNLTGADVVIHYDPWWNPATEDQATDRAHRIGQTKKVDVIRLVTGESIEEQVAELGKRKKALFDRLITPGEADLTALSEQDIRALFE